MTETTNSDLARNLPPGLPVGHQAIVRLCQDASVEISFHDAPKVKEVSALLPAGCRVFISFLPKQTWEQSIDTAVEVSKLGLTPVPHIPARLIHSARELDQALAQLAQRASVSQVLLIAGDRPDPAGPFSASSEILRTGLLEKHGISRVNIAGHPEGHPRVSDEILRAAETERVQCAERAGLEACFVTQFAFDSSPIIEWVRGLRARGIRNGVRVGLAGPAKFSTLLQYAARCGVGPSIRALSSRASSFGRLLSESGPESLVSELAQARSGGLEIDGIHLFSFGGLARTCRWLHAVGHGRFTLDDDQGFIIDQKA
jgi:methylenetetrahydrofolate reductase (NADPH)